MSDLSHLNAIEYRLSNERIRRDNSTGKERVWREHNIKMIERELQGEIDFLASKGITVDRADEEMTLEEIMKELEL